MRLMIVGSLDGYITDAGRIAMARGAKVAHAESTDQALKALRGGRGADLLMVDVKQDLAKLVDQLKTERIHIEVVACGIENDAKAAVSAIRAGAKEYVPLPPDAELIAAVLEAVAEESQQILTRDPRMQQVLKLAEQVAPSDASVLITGDSGTGKELMARFLHVKSRRSEKPFVSVNCAAIPDNLLESELFGHEKGAFTGALTRRIGKFEEADGGTLLLDEISEMDVRLQAKLLRAIQEREIDRVGGTTPVRVNIRVLATSNRNMEESVKKGDFREDLFFRLNVVNVQLPSLKERPKDIGLLAEFFAEKYAEANGMPKKRLAPDALARLEAHHWRGNIRELENTIHRGVLLSLSDIIGADAIHLTYESDSPAATVSTAAQRLTANAPSQPKAPEPPVEDAMDMLEALPFPSRSLGSPGGTIPTTDAQPDRDDAAENAMIAGTASLVGRTVAEVERDLILDTLSHTLGNRTHAATILGISIRTLRNKLKQYSEEGVDVPMPGEGDTRVFT